MNLAKPILTLVATVLIAITMSGTGLSQVTVIGRVHSTCHPLKNPGCPDFEALTQVFGTWKEPRARDDGLVSASAEFARTINEPVLVFWYHPNFSRFDAKLELQALGILNGAQWAMDKTYTLAVAHTYWYDDQGHALVTDSYIFLRNKTSQNWVRNRSASLTDLVIKADLRSPI